MNIVPITTDPFQRFTIQMESSVVEWTVSYGALRNLWTLDLAVDGVRVLAGKTLTSGVDLLLPYNLGLGFLVCVPVGEVDKDAGLDELGDRVLIIIGTQAEADAISTV